MNMWKDAITLLINEIPTRRAKSKVCGKVLEWVELLWINGQNEKHFSYLGKQFGYFL